MYHKVRITVVSLVAVVLVMLSSVGTLSYFTDTDFATNNFVVGNASTSLAMYGDVSGETKLALDTTPVEVGTSRDFHLQATNDGNIPVYQRFRVVIPIAFAGLVTLELPDMGNCTLTTTVGTTDSSVCSNEYYTMKYDPSVLVENTATYAEYYITSKSPLAVNSSTHEWPTLKVTFGNIASVDNYESLLACSSGDANNCALGLKVYSDAIQTTGFSDALNAFENFAETYN